MSDWIETVEQPDGSMEVYVARPDGRGPFPVVVQIMDALGMREELRAHAQRTASWGYYVIAPDLFHREGLKGPIDISKSDNLAVVMAAMQAQTAARTLDDVRAALKLAEDRAARPGKIGLYGFCMGGKLALQLAQALGDRVAAVASIHPGGLVTPEADSPHRQLDHVTAELYFGIADEDATATPAQMAQLEAALGTQHIHHQLEWHPGALHGYMMPSRGEVYNRDAAEKVWGRMQKLFDRVLR